MSLLKLVMCSCAPNTVRQVVPRGRACDGERTLAELQTATRDEQNAVRLTNINQTSSEYTSFLYVALSTVTDLRASDESNSNREFPLHTSRQSLNSGTSLVFQTKVTQHLINFSVNLLCRYPFQLHYSINSPTF